MLAHFRRPRLTSFAACVRLSFASSAASRDAPQPVEIKLRSAANRLQLSFDDGRVFSLPGELLRVKAPSADNQRRDASGLAMVPAGRRHVRIMGVEPVGGYAIRIKFDDLHHVGIYSWAYLYDLGDRKLTHCREYIRALRARGLSRQPARTAAAGVPRPRRG